LGRYSKNIIYMKKKIFYILSLIIVFIMGIVMTITVYNIFINRNISKNTIEEIKLTESDTISSSIKKINDATVYIKAEDSNGSYTTGSGFIYKVDDKNIYIITNSHVIENSNKINIVNSYGKLYNASLVGSDIYNDVAVLKIELYDNVLIAQIGNSDQTKVGDTVFTVGSPLGIEYINTVTKGTISGKNRTVEVDLKDGKYMMEVMQLDAAMNPGNSGGPLCNLKGEVIGINALKLVKDEVEGMGFAIPIETAVSIAFQLESGKKIKRPFIGIDAISVTDSWQLYNKEIYLDNDIKEGIVITNIEDNSIASAVGLKKGDVITKLDSDVINSPAYFKYLLYNHKIGDKVNIKYYRDKKFYTIKVALDKELK